MRDLQIWRCSISDFRPALQLLRLLESLTKFTSAITRTVKFSSKLCSLFQEIMLILQWLSEIVLFNLKWLVYSRYSIVGLCSEWEHRPVMVVVWRLFPVPKHFDGGPIFAPHRRQDLGTGRDAIPWPSHKAVSRFFRIKRTSSGHRSACAAGEKICPDLSAGLELCFVISC